MGIARNKKCLNIPRKIVSAGGALSPINFISVWANNINFGSLIWS